MGSDYLPPLLPPTEPPPLLFCRLILSLSHPLSLLLSLYPPHTLPGLEFLFPKLAASATQALSRIQAAVTNTKLRVLVNECAKAVPQNFFFCAFTDSHSLW